MCKRRTEIHSVHIQKSAYLSILMRDKGWKLYNPISPKVLMSQDVSFDETSFPGLTAHQPDDHFSKVKHQELWLEQEDQEIEATCNEPISPIPAPDQDDGPNTLQTQSSPSESLPSDDQGVMQSLDTQPHYRPPMPQYSDEMNPQNQLHPISPTTQPPLVAQGNHPIRSKHVLNYGELDGRMRRTTKPVEH